MTYAEQLKHPNWQRRRLEILQRAEFRCESCADADTTLHVHHKIYRKGSKAWEYSDSELEALCERCHEAETLLRRELDEALALLDSSCLETLLGYAKALAIAAGNVAQEDEIKVRSAEEAEGLGRGFGLTFMESQYLLCRTDPLPVADLHRLHDDAWKRNRRLLYGHEAETSEELAAISSSLTPTPLERSDT